MKKDEANFNLSSDSKTTDNYKTNFQYKAIGSSSEVYGNNSSSLGFG